ncbi:protein kinase domain-containing protein [Acinetobacter wanghuae]|uniref:protein kinase domain-containing protein n=1 Tax=Acinetobacter wanghuae TaxID=2662362 RepID=UPI0020906D41|nr:protein kinase [Acinetobacter wanghuae]
MKTQTHAADLDSLHAQQGFEREFNFYLDHAYDQSLDFFVSHQLIHETFQINQTLFQQAILCRHYAGYFDRSPLTLSAHQIKQHLLGAIEPFIQLEQSGYIHADLKQEHFLDNQGRVGVIDFEQVQSLMSPIQQPMNATPRYMAPELFHGQLKSVQSDIYALGIIFLEWLTQKRLMATTYQDWAYLHCQYLQVELLSEFRCFEGVLQQMLRKHKSQRLPSFSAVKSLLMTEIE